MVTRWLPSVVGVVEAFDCVNTSTLEAVHALFRAIETHFGVGLLQRVVAPIMQRVITESEELGNSADEAERIKRTFYFGIMFFLGVGKCLFGVFLSFLVSFCPFLHHFVPYLPHFSSFSPHFSRLF